MINELTMYAVCRKGKRPVYMSKSNGIDNIMQLWECQYAVDNFIFDDKEEALNYALSLEKIGMLITPKIEKGTAVYIPNVSKEEIERWF